MVLCCFSKTLGQLFFDACFFLYHTNMFGVIQNPEKFNWGKRELEFLGFWIKEDGVKPTQETLAAITDFPRPTDITGIRLFYGLVVQVAFAFAKTELMMPFRNLLSKNAVYAWSPELQRAFESPKSEIAKLVADGVSSFEVDKYTCIVTDWSKVGIGFVMWQKRCACTKIHPSCCPNGWVLVTCGSRFCTAAESRYHPVEGELLGVTWALQKMGYYTLGTDILLVLVDHKPLLGLLASRNLNDIENPRLLHLAERLLRWTFKIEHRAGATNFAPDALSRFPSQPKINAINYVPIQDHQSSNTLDAQVLATTVNNKQFVFTSWDQVRQAGISDPHYSDLLHLIQENQDNWPETHKEYARYRKDMSTVEGITLLKNRIIIPPLLRAQILSAIHQSHQGTSGMNLRAQDSVWWPSLTQDIAEVRNTCNTCHMNVPSQQPLPPIHPPLPKYPFQLISSDYFALEGHNYLIIVDRYSFWPVVKQCKTESAQELISSLREFFYSYGVPDEIATDGGPTYTAAATQDFLNNWQVKHRLSSAYNPHANMRAETAVKSIKRILRDNIGRAGSLDTDKVAASLLNYRNTPDRDTSLSPAQILFARSLKDTIPTNPVNLQLRPEWILTAEARERALSRRHLARQTDLQSHAKQLKPLTVGSIVQVQNQRGNNPNKWDMSGVVVEVLDFNAYNVKLDGTGRISKRNRQFLRPITPYDQQLVTKLPLQTFPPDLIRDQSHTPGRVFNEVTDEFTSVLRDKDNQTVQDIQITDRDSDSRLTDVTNNVRHQTQTTVKSPTVQLPSYTRPKRVKFATKRYIEQ